MKIEDLGRTFDGLLDGQTITSAKTSLKQVPAIVRLGDARGYWQRGAVNLDLGGGAYDLTTEALAERGVESHVVDPYNRTEQHNDRVLGLLAHRDGADTVTCSNVLNVIDSNQAVDDVIYEARLWLKPGGVAYFTVYEGDRSNVGRITSKGYQRNQRIAKYVEAISERFGADNVTRKGMVIEASNPCPPSDPNDHWAGEERFNYSNER